MYSNRHSSIYYHDSTTAHLQRQCRHQLRFYGRTGILVYMYMLMHVYMFSFVFDRAAMPIPSVVVILIVSYTCHPISLQTASGHRNRQTFCPIAVGRFRSTGWQLFVQVQVSIHRPPIQCCRLCMFIHVWVRSALGRMVFVGCI